MVIRSLSVSDIHLFHRQTPTLHIVANFKSEIGPYIESGLLDILFIPGDIFEEITSLPDDNVGIAQRWMVWLLKTCARHDVLIRILEGTPSHDRKMSKQFIILNEELEQKANIKYFDDISVEYVEEKDVYVLYIPDEIRASPDIVQSDVKKLLFAHGLTKVHYTVMHGLFNYQLPIPYIQAHDEGFYKSITLAQIFCGHYHEASENGQIKVAGSFDRLKHRHESDKGFWVTEDRFENDIVVSKAKFHVNKNAMLYKTFNLVGLVESDIHEKLSILKTYPKLAAIKVICEKNTITTQLIAVYKDAYPWFKWAVEFEKVINANSPLIQPEVFVGVEINKNTIYGLLENRLDTHFPNVEKSSVLNTLTRIMSRVVEYESA